MKKYLLHIIFLLIGTGFFADQILLNTVSEIFDPSTKTCCCNDMDDTEKSNDSPEDDQYIEKDFLVEHSYVHHQYDVGIVHQTNRAVANWTDHIFTLLGPPPKA